LAVAAAIKGAQIAFALFQTKLLATGAILPTISGLFSGLFAIVKAHPIGLLTTALISGAALIIANWEEVKNFFATIWDEIKPIWEKFSNFAIGIFDQISSPFAAIKSGIGSLFRSDDQKSSLSSKLPPMKNEKAAITDRKSVV
jgi:hypothetical protein